MRSTIVNWASRELYSSSRWGCFLCNSVWFIKRFLGLIPSAETLYISTGRMSMQLYASWIYRLLLLSSSFYDILKPDINFKHKLKKLKVARCLYKSIAKKILNKRMTNRKMSWNEYSKYMKRKLLFLLIPVHTRIVSGVTKGRILAHIPLGVAEDYIKTTNSGTKLSLKYYRWLKKHCGGRAGIKSAAEAYGIRYRVINAPVCSPCFEAMLQLHPNHRSRPRSWLIG